MDSYNLLSHRGPDSHKVLELDDKKGVFAFHRLAIMGQGASGDQPFTDHEQKVTLVCNGEIYNYQQIKTDYIDSYGFKSKSDCEVILPLYKEFKLKQMCQILDGEFAFVIHDRSKDLFFAGRDPMGIRPLFYGYKKEDGGICFASEAKALLALCEEVKPFPPGHYYDGKSILCYQDLSVVSETSMQLDEALAGIHKELTLAVKKRLHSDAPIGFLLSGGLDSSLVCAIAAKLSDKPIKTFAVGITENPIDTKYARIVADYLGTDHHEYLFTKEQTLSALSDVIYHLETWDITTIRAAMGMFMISKYVKEQTDVKVLLTGEVSDELFGYKYTDFAPSEDAFREEAAKRVKELYLYDVLRADRSISAHSLEARVPFGDKNFVEFVMSIPTKLKMNTTGIGKYLLRKAFEQGDYLPQDILYRDKAAFSDAVGHSLVDWLKEYAEQKYSDEEYELKAKSYSHGRPFTKESLLYREIFDRHFKGAHKLIPDYWMPNKEWENCDVSDPSARVLPNYGASGE
jgi:asparagine synthase (glutamine-hydrolysing)